MYQVSMDEFAGEGETFAQGLEREFGNRAMEEAMKILENPKLHNPELRKKKMAKVVSRTYDLSNEKDRKAYERDVSNVLNCESGNLLLLDRPPKQFVQTGGSYKYVAYLEWADYSERTKSADKANKNLVKKRA